MIDAKGGGVVAVGGAVGFVVLTAVLSLPGVRAVDLAVRDCADAHRPPAADAVAQAVNWLGSGGRLAGVALVIALVLAWRRRSPGPLAPVIVAFGLLTVVVWPLKLLADRAPPHSPLPSGVEVTLFSGGVSYPSGHAVNAIVWWGVICSLLAPWLSTTVRRWLRWTPPVLVTLAGTYLGYHWLTDMLAGLCLGLALSPLVDLGVLRVTGDQLTRSSPRSPG